MTSTERKIIRSTPPEVSYAFLSDWLAINCAECTKPDQVTGCPIRIALENATLFHDPLPEEIKDVIRWEIYQEQTRTDPCMIAECPRKEGSA
ncbi:MAG: hypothetical protein WC277_07985 [Bacilli bacterium]